MKHVCLQKQLWPNLEMRRSCLHQQQIVTGLRGQQIWDVMYPKSATTGPSLQLPADASHNDPFPAQPSEKWIPTPNLAPRTVSLKLEVQDFQLYLQGQCTGMSFFVCAAP